MKIALIYLNDLFYNSGTAVIVRKLFENLTLNHEVIHLIGDDADIYRSSTEIEISELYQNLSFKITPFFLNKQKFIYYYEFLVTKTFHAADPRLTGLSYAFQISKILKKEKPDCVWCVLCHMPQTLPIIYFLRKWFGFTLPLHISIYDPLELWPKAIGAQYFYRYIVKSAVSVDTIGTNLQERIHKEFKKNPLILNDYIDALNFNESTQKSFRSVRVVIAGQIYSKSDIQLFLDIASRVFVHTSIFWYGNERNYSLLNQLSVPENIEILKKGLVDRTLLPSLISDFTFAYLSMPQDAEHFARYSVPTKLVTYLEAGLPIVFHAPIYSEVHEMNSEFGFGINLSYLHNFEEKLTSIVVDRDIYQKGITRLYLVRYSKRIVITKFWQIISNLEEQCNHEFY